MTAPSSSAQWVSAIAAFVALFISIGTFILTEHRHRKADRAEKIRSLLAHHSSVGYAANRLLLEGLPKPRDERRLMIQAIIHACFFEGSDRARALLYAVIRRNEADRDEFQTAFSTTSTAFREMKGLEGLDLKNFEKLVSPLEAVVNGKNALPASTSTAERPKHSETGVAAQPSIA